MSRISIDVTPDEHKKLKALAAIQGKSIKDFVLEATLGSQGGSVQADLARLEADLDQRIAEARVKGGAEQTVESIFQQARDEATSNRDA